MVTRCGVEFSQPSLYIVIHGSVYMYCRAVQQLGYCCFDCATFAKNSLNCAAKLTVQPQSSATLGYYVFQECFTEAATDGHV
jgi:hypothetical protein